MENIAEIFYGILFEPVKTFRAASFEKPYKLPLILVLIASMFLVLLQNSPIVTGMVFLTVAFNLIIYWLFVTFFVDLIARMFNINGNFSKLLTLTAFSFVPWVFIAPLKFMKSISPLFSDISIILLLGLWLWSFVLQILAISETYNIARKNAIVIIFIPFLGSILYLTWVIDFFIKLFAITAL